MTPADVIEEKGGSAAVARALGIEPVTVRMWKSRNRLPRSAWPELTDAFPDLDNDALRAIEAQGKAA